MRELTDAERAMFWRARRGLKELDVFFEPFMRDHYLPEDAELSHIIKVIYERVGVGQSR